MNPEHEAHREASPANEPEQESPTNKLFEQLDAVLRLGKDSLKLVDLELRLAVKQLPSILAITLISPLLLALIWLSASVTFAWLMFDLYQHLGIAFASFTLLQIAAYIFCRLWLRSLKRQASLPYTRQLLGLSESPRHQQRKPPHEPASTSP